MHSDKFVTKFLIGLFVFVMATSSVAVAQVEDKVRKTKKEVDKIYKDWVSKDVKYIITPEEKKAFKQLATNEERENFIENFWRRRDPNPDTEENEYREEYYERIAYANENFTSGIPGMENRPRSHLHYLG